MLRTIIAFFSALYSQATNTITSCGGDFQNIYGVIVPDQLIKNQEAYFYISYDVPYEVNSGSVETTLNANGVIYPDINSKLCDSIPCPIKVGSYNHNSSFPLTNIDGNIRSKIRWYSDAGTLLLCMKIMIDILPAAR